MFAFLIAFGASDIYRKHQINTNEAIQLSLNETDVVYINTLGLTDSNITFTLKPHMTIMKLEKDEGYLFSGDTLEIEASSSLEVPLWLIPKGYCTYNNYIINADFALQFVSEDLSKFCIFTPLDYNSGSLRYHTERYSVDEGSDFLLARSDKQSISHIKEMTTEKFSAPVAFMGLTENLNTGNFKFEINVANFNKCAMRKIVDVSGQGSTDKWMAIDPKCGNLRKPAFSLTFSSLVMTIITMLIGYFLIDNNYLDWKQLIGYEYFRRSDFPVQPTEPPRAEEEHLEIDLIQDPPLENPNTQETNVL